VLIASAMAGWINGRAPLFERFVLGNSRTLRGWSKWDVAPLGSDQMVHASIDYSYREFRVVYDAGSSRAFGGDRKLRQSIAVGYGRGFGFLIAFPLREGRMEPIFMLGMNF
jgi:outer membrane protein assembly factor BamA